MGEMRTFQSGFDTSFWASLEGPASYNEHSDNEHSDREVFGEPIEGCRDDSRFTRKNSTGDRGVSWPRCIHRPQACGLRCDMWPSTTSAAPRRRGELLDQVRKAGGTAEMFQADVREESAVSGMVAQVSKTFGPIDILVVNATGPQPFIKLEELTWRACLDQLEFFVKSPVLLAKAVLPSMKQRRSGRIINIGSEVFERRAGVLELCLGQGGAAGPDALLGDGVGALADHGEPRRAGLGPHGATRQRFAGVEGRLRRRRADAAHGRSGRHR